LGYYEGPNCYAIDTGCLWGGQLTALKLGDQVQRISIDCPCAKKPSKNDYVATTPALEKQLESSDS